MSRIIFNWDRFRRLYELKHKVIEKHAIWLMSTTLTEIICDDLTEYDIVFEAAVDADNDSFWDFITTRKEYMDELFPVE